MHIDNCTMMIRQKYYTPQLNLKLASAIPKIVTPFTSCMEWYKYRAPRPLYHSVVFLYSFVCAFCFQKEKKKKKIGKYKRLKKIRKEKTTKKNKQRNKTPKKLLGRS